MSWREAPLPTRAHLGLVLGPVAFGSILATDPFALPAEATAVLAATAWVVIWWVSEAIPIPVTSLLPIVLFPATGVLSASNATMPYADSIVFLLLGGFLIALAIERWNLHHRFSLLIIVSIGLGARRLLLGFMVATGVLSMWISNTATAMMMVPIAAGVIVELTVVAGRRVPPLDREDIERPSGATDPSETLVRSVDADPETLPNTAFGTALMLGIAFGASIGGAATLIGSPPNAVMAGVAESSLGVDIGFLEWMFVGVPVAVVFMAIAWGVLVITLRPSVERQPAKQDLVREQLDELGSLTTGEQRVLAVFGLVVAGWLTRPFLIEPVFPFVTDATIAVAGAVLVFMVPVGDERLLDWSHTERVPWGVLLLLGAGFSIARAFQASGLDRIIADAIAGLGVTDLFGLVLIVTVTVVLLTNVTSNTATAALFMPIVISLAEAVALEPLVLMAAAAFSASFAFMLPVATAPNAIVFGSGYLTIPTMARIGGWLTVAAVVVITIATVFWVPLVWS